MSAFSKQCAICLFLLSSLAIIASAQAQQAPARSWTETKCDRYAQAYTDAVARLSTQGLRPDFISRHDAFLASGCATGRVVCPESAEELRLANVLVIRGMNAGMASTFFPFACSKDAATRRNLSVDPRHAP